MGIINRHKTADRVAKAYNNKKNQIQKAKDAVVELDSPEEFMQAVKFL